MIKTASVLFTKLRDPLFYAGLVVLAFYIRYLYVYLYFDNTFQYLLWYSSVGLIFLAIALLLRNYILLSIVFCSLFAIEGIWFANFFLALFFDFSVGNKSYNFIPGSPDFDPVGSVYHLLLAPLSLLGILLVDKAYKKAWIYSSGAALSLGLLTYAFLDNSRGENINCVFQSCEQLFSSVYQIPNPARIFLGAFLLGLFVFLPTNYLILLFKQNTVGVNQTAKFVRSLAQLHD